MTLQFSRSSRWVWVTALVGASMASAQSAGGPARAAHLLDPSQTSSMVARLDVSPLADLVPAATDASNEASTSEAIVAGPTFGVHFAKTLGVGVASSATGVLLGTLFGTLSNNLIWAAIPVLLSNLFVGPVVTALVAMLLGNDGAPGRYGFWGPAGVAFVLHAALYVILSLLPQFAVPWSNPVALLLYSLVDGLLMTGGSVGLMHLTEKKAETTSIQSFVPGVSDTQFVALTKVGF